MKTLGIIVEYNPLHNGHVYHIQQSRAATGADAVVAVMSGNFLQRGEPAVVSKWARAEMALSAGVDLVIELPAAYASQPAEWFAFGAVSALDATGVVDTLCFGSESGELAWLEQLAEELSHESESFRVALKAELKNGISYPEAYSIAAAKHSSRNSADGESAPSDQLHEPNNALGLHYLIALRRLNSRIVPATIHRQKAGYHDTRIRDHAVASATAIRKMLFDRESGGLHAAAAYMPEDTLRILEREWKKGRGPMSWEHYAQPLLTKLLSLAPHELAEYYEVSEGLEHRIASSLPSLTLTPGRTVQELLQALKTKRYTLTKLQRMLLRILLGHRKSDYTRSILSQGVKYLRVLGFNQTGQLLLKQMKKNASVPVLLKATRANRHLLDTDLRAAAVYSAAFPQTSSHDIFQDYYTSPLRIGVITK